jgi:hypothetical protein
MSDKQKCPLCDQPNHCEMAEGQSVSVCWCTSIRLTVDMLEAVPTKDRSVRCICATCARALATASPNQDQAVMYAQLQWEDACKRLDLKLVESP